MSTTSLETENTAIQKFFEEYYGGFSVFSPKNRPEGFNLDYPHYLKKEAFERVFFRAVTEHLNFHNMAPLKILDVGCGDGHKLRWFLEYGAQPENLFGVDSSPTIIENAKRLSSPFIHFQQAMGDKLPFEDQTFDLILCSGVIIHVMDDSMIQAMADEFRRVTKPSGGLLLVVTNELVEYGEGWMKQRARTFDRRKNEVEKIFPQWATIHRDDTLYEHIGTMLQIIGENSKDPKDIELLRNRKSDEEVLIQGTMDYDISKMLRTFKFGSVSLYVLKPAAT